MKAARLNVRPNFTLMKQTDIQSIYHMQMPRWLFSDPRYCDMSLDAKVTYTFLLNRFQLSRRNNWVNDQGEVFVIFPRKALAKELRICEQRITAAFRKLIELELVWEKRCGRGDANQIYLATVCPIDDPDYQCAPFVDEDADPCGCRTVDIEVLEDYKDVQEPQYPLFLNRKTGASRTADPATLEPQNPLPSNNNLSHIDLSQREVSPSVYPGSIHQSDGQTDDEEELLDILDACDLDTFQPETAQVFENAIERLFYSDSFRISNATLPQKRVRSKLHLLNAMILRDAELKMANNTETKIRNSTTYTMVVIFNCISESESDLMVDPYLNTLRSPPGRR